MNDTLITADCTGTVADVTARLQRELQTRDVAVFATIDHAAGARAAGLDMQDEVVVIFGNPAVGTALMQESPSIGYELPLRMLIWDDHGTTRIAYRAPSTLGERFGIHTAAPVLAKLDGLLGTLRDALSR
ncbi:DUF302 domain-containing protein [Leifsonia shinshuensis]|uniref:DUF302 domain-containing protein n=1 Tax=Leifsonia shinshuensis TaxID=150026 RepID=UPI00285B291F|nr:DUF302 domain-containing protein [Leifsonia shinshuensis]MDR6972776.1 uncharacterized protein (DUF302 family) [Leifsonia shinshuensis]